MQPRQSYSADEKSRFSLADCEAAVGSHATLPLTGVIVEAGESSSGPFVKFDVDERWGFPPGARFVLDLDALEGVE